MDASPQRARVFRLVLARPQHPAGWGKRDEGEEENFADRTIRAACRRLPTASAHTQEA